MPNNRPLLTIAVPTFNRARYLDQFLSVLFDQIREEPRVELIISDNASPDDTPDVVRQYQDKGLSIRYVRNPENIGPDGNILQAFELAKGKYVWVFGDDDIIESGGIGRILSLLASETPDIIFCAHYGFRGSYHDGPHEIQARQHTEIINNPINFVHFANRHGDFVFISAVITNKDLISQNPHPPFQKFLQTNVVQLGWHFTALKYFRKGIFVELGTVAGTAADTGIGLNAARVFAVNYVDAVNTFIGPDSPLAKVLVRDQLLLWFPRHWVHMRQRAGLLSSRDTRQTLTSLFAAYPIYWLIVHPIATLPLPVARIYSKIIRVMQRFTRIDLTAPIRPTWNKFSTKENRIPEAGSLSIEDTLSLGGKETEVQHAGEGAARN